MTKILVIEDEEPVRDNILDLLETENFEAIAAENGLVGLCLAREHEPDLIICDIMMPELDGYGVLKALRQDPVTMSIPLIFLTAKADRANTRKGMELGADDYITKPCTPDELLKAINTRLEKQAALEKYYASTQMQLLASLQEAQAKLNYLLYHDPLTNLQNRLSLRDQFEQLLQKATRKTQRQVKKSPGGDLTENPENQSSSEERSPEKNSDCLFEFAVLCFGLDRYNRISSTLGQTSCNLLIQLISQRLKSCTGSDDAIALLSADEFAFILAPCFLDCQPLDSLSEPDFSTEDNAGYPNSEQDRHDRIDPKQKVLKLGLSCEAETNNIRSKATQFAQTLLETITLPFNLDSQEVFITASIGIAIYPTDGLDIEKLLHHANIAMNHVRQNGGNNYRFYTALLNIKSADLLFLETSLRYALDKEEFEVYYQPKVNLLTGRIVGAEALIRWHHPERGIISPAQFISLAEETGLIIPISEWVLRTASIQLKKWQRQFIKYPQKNAALQIAVNLSARQFSQLNLPKIILQILTETGLNAQALELELTESLLVQNPELANKSLNTLKNIGVNIAVDDFGTGYSSLRYLQQFHFDILKIDRCFVHNLGLDRKNNTLTKAIISIAHQLNIKVVAEGVETQEELDFLRSNHCDEIQGYLFSPPVNAESFENLLMNNKSLYSSSPFNEIHEQGA